MGPLGLLTLAVLAAPSRLDVTVLDRDERGCGKPALGGMRLAGGPRDGCLVDAFAARLEDPSTLNVVLVIDRPGRFDSRVRRRLFVYRLEGARLVPRFLGSGPSELALVGARRVEAGPPEWLEVSVQAGGDSPRALRCRFEGFPLVCEVPP